MTFPEPGIIESLRQVMSKNPDGITISGIAEKTKINRNLIAKYLDYLLRSGQLEMKKFGSSKIYALASRAPVSSLVHHTFDPVILLDHDHRIRNVNNSMLSLLDEPKEKLIGMEIGLINNSILMGLVQNIQREINSGQSGEIMGLTTTVRESLRQFNARTIPVVYDDGKNGMAIILHDISLERKYQQILDLTKARDDCLNEDIPDFVMNFLPDGTFTFMNPAMSRFFKKRPGENPDINIHSIILLEDLYAIEKGPHMITKENPARNLQCRIINPSGEIRHFDWTIRGIFNPDNTLHEYQGVGRDITEQQAAREKINRLIEERALLYRMSCEFSLMSRDRDIFEIIGHGVKEILPTTIVAINSFEAADSAMKTRCFLGDQEREVFSNYFGKDIVGHVMEAPETMERDHVIQNVMGGKLYKVPGNLYVMMMGQIPMETCEKIEQHLNIGDMYVIGLVSGNQLFGNIGLFLRKGETMKHNELLEIYIRYATLALKCRYLEEDKVIPVPNKEIYASKKPVGFGPSDSIQHI